MPDRMPILINPEHAATRGLQTSGVLKLKDMARLNDRLVAPFGEVNVELTFGKQGQRMFVQGSIAGYASLQCQRCLQAVKQEINHKFKLGMIQSDAEVDCLLPGEEPMLISGEDYRLADIIEDELELLLPMVVKHPDDQCESGMEPAADEPELEEVKTSKNPFAELVDLKKS